MKAISLLKPLEFSLETIGETWAQGTTLQGKLKIRNMGTEVQTLAPYKVALAYAEIKKVHAKASGCFKVTASHALSAVQIGANETYEYSFEFKLDANISVSDKKASFHLLYGNLETPFHLQLSIVPNPQLLEMNKILDTFLRFKFKEYKGTPKGADFIFIPPSTKEYATVESLSLAYSIFEQELKLDFHFSLKKLDLTGATNKIVKDSKLISKTLTPKDYLMGKTHLDQDKLLKVFEAVLLEIKPKHLL